MTQRIRKMTRQTWRTSLLALPLFILAIPALAQVDRYGGVWNEGVATGPFVPLDVGMTYGDLQAYMGSWEGYRLTDFEVVHQGCPAEQVDLFASQWEEVSWKDLLEDYGSLVEFSDALVNRCEEGFKLIDFEIWKTTCRQMNTRYIALYTDAEGCEIEPGPAIHGSAPEDFRNVVDSENGAGYELVDFEADDLLNPSSILGVFYAGNTEQRFDLYERTDFEQEMLAAEGARKLVDMESYQEQPWWPEGTPPTRLVAGLWEAEAGARDDHEVGEVYGLFEQLLFKDWSVRRLVDFEIHPKTWDRRFDEVFRSYLGNDPLAWGVGVRQLGEDVGSTGGGLATRPDPGQGLAAVPMSNLTRGVTASVTKFVTAVGVIAYAETQNPVNPPDWLDQSITTILPADFANLGAGVANITLRDVLMQRTGLSNFTPTVLPWVDPVTYRAETVAWLQQPVMLPKPPPPSILPFNYQNAHFDLLALAMAEVVAPLYPTSSDPWRDWMNDNVFAPIGVSPRRCGWTSADARSYPFVWSTNHHTWASPTYPCDGYGTGSAMWFLSPDDLSRLMHGVRSATLVSPPHLDEVFTQGLGLDQWGQASQPYQGTQDFTPGVYGEILDSKNGGVGWWVNGELVGTETLVVTYDDFNFDDDLYNLYEYSYELGGTGFDIGIAIHSSAVDSTDPCLPQNSGCPVTRLYPAAMTMIQEAFRQPEAW